MKRKSKSAVMRCGVSFIVLWCLVISIPIRVLGWGDEGHRIVGRIAGQALTKKAKATITELLTNDPFVAQCQQHNIPMATVADKLACVATWADNVRGQRPETAGWHFVDIPRNTNEYVASRDCPEGNCVIQALERVFTVLVDVQSKPTDRTEALKFVVHFVGDIHQPLHDATDTQDQEAIANGFPAYKGGNFKFVTWLGQRKNKFGNWELHAVWDSGIIENIGQNDVLIADQLTTSLTSEQKKYATPSIAAGSAAWRTSLDRLLIQWAEEGHALAIHNAYFNLGSQDAHDVAVEKGKKKYHRYHLTQAYLTANQPIVTNQLQNAGVRLARLLNEALR